MEEIKINEINTILVTKGGIVFPQYDELKEDAQKVYDYLSTVEVTDDTVKANKKLVAAVNKSIKTLEDERIRVKKELLEPYAGFESQIKEIVGIVKEADTLVRDQIKDLEEIERDHKREDIESLFDRRIKQYTFSEIFVFEDFIENRHLNKTISIETVEKELVEWLEKIQGDMSTIQIIPDSKEVMTEYVTCKDLNQAIKAVSDRKALSEKVGEVVADVEVFIYKVFDKKDSMIIEAFMNDTKIKFERVGK